MILAACVAPAAIDVTVADLTVTIPALYADQWILAILEDPDHTYGVVPGLLGAEDADALRGALLAGSVPADAPQEAALAAISEAAGRPWWEALRLISAANEPSGNVYGHLLLKGVDPARTTLAGWCAALYALLTRGLDDKARTQFEFDMQLPPQGADIDDANWDTVRW